MAVSRSVRVGGAGMLALVATYGIGRQAFGLFVPAFRREFGLGLDELGLYASAAQVGYLLATVATGALTARFGVRVPVVLGCLTLAAGAAATAVAGGPALLAVGVVAAGTSAGGTWGPFSDAVAARVPDAGERRALALVNAGAPVGLVVASLAVLVAGGRWRVAWWLFAAVGLLAAVVNLRVLSAGGAGRGASRPWPGLRHLLHRRSAPLFTVTFAAAVTSGAYFAYAPDTAQAGGLPVWSGPAMWAALGVAGGAVGILGGRIAHRFSLRGPLVATLVLLAASTLLLAAPGSLALALVSAGAFGVAFTLGFAFLAMWSQDVFADHPTSGFTVTIVCLALGFSLGPVAFGVLATGVGRLVAVVVAALPPVLATVAARPAPAHA